MRFTPKTCITIASYWETLERVLIWRFLPKINANMSNNFITFTKFTRHHGELSLKLNMFSTCFRYGEIININLVRDKKTGKSKGFCFIAYEDQRSTIVAVDNFNGTKVRRS